MCFFKIYRFLIRLKTQNVYRDQLKKNFNIGVYAESKLVRLASFRETIKSKNLNKIRLKYDNCSFIILS